VVVEVKAIACQLPSELGLPLSRLHVPDIRQEVLRRGLVAEISGTTIWRWLTEDAIRPWAHRSWIFPRSPPSPTTTTRLLRSTENQVEIYLSIVKRKALTPRDFVDLVDAEDRLHRFEQYYQASAAPFEWKFTRADLTALLWRLAAHRSLQPAA
jgi:hypothetical protein